MMYKQPKESEYCNNEFSNMPSLCGIGERLTTKNIDSIDMELVRSIAEKYGFEIKVVKGTFGCIGERGIYSAKVYICKTLPIYENTLTNLQEKRCFDFIEELCPKELCVKLHECIHELDERTPLYFRNGWGGNCGYFGSYDVNRRVYSYGDYPTKYSTIINYDSPSINDTAKSFHRGEVYLEMNTQYLKKVA